MKRGSHMITVTALALAILGIAAAGAEAAAGGASDAAHLCQKGGWQNVLTSTGQPLTSQGDCISYAAHGGVLSPRPTASLLFDFGACPGHPSYTANCPAASFVGSGLMSGAPVTECDASVGCVVTDIVVEADGTLPDQYASYARTCITGHQYTVSTTTAAGATITASDTCVQ